MIHVRRRYEGFQTYSWRTEVQCDWRYAAHRHTQLTIAMPVGLGASRGKYARHEHHHALPVLGRPTRQFPRPNRSPANDRDALVSPHRDKL